MLTITVSLPVFAGGDLGVQNESGSDVSAADVTEPDVTETDVSETDEPIPEPIPEKPYGEMRGLTAAEYIADMKTGYNLGHSLDSWAQDAGYSDYYNCNAYSVQVLYEDYNPPQNDDKKSKKKKKDDDIDTLVNPTTSEREPFNEDGTYKIEWNTGFIMSDPRNKAADIGFYIVYNSTIDKPTDVVVNVKKAHYKRRSGGSFNFEDLLGEHVLTIYPSKSEYSSVVRCMTSVFPKGIEHTRGINDGTFTLEIELTHYPQKNYTKEQYFEALWNNPLTNQEVIDRLKEAGYNSVRLPVTYFNHINPDTNVIDAAWLDRVEEVVGYVLRNEMYCIINMQNDGSTSGWLRVDAEKTDEIKDKYTVLWKQIAERFRPYGDYLLFEGYGALTDTEENWNYPGQDKIDWVNDLAQRFVDAVRATGGNNSDRLLLVSPYAASSDEEIMRGLKLPRDTASDRLAVALQAYEPVEFSLPVGGADSWGSDTDKQKLDEFFDRINNAYTKKNIPVIITEFGSAAKEAIGQSSTYKAEVTQSDVSGGDEQEQEKEKESKEETAAGEPAILTEEAALNKPEVKLNTNDRVNHAQYYIRRAKELGVACHWWDDGSLFDRQFLTWEFPEVSDAMINASAVHVMNLTISDIKDQTASEDFLTPLEPAVTVYDGDRLLTEGEDYTLRYTDNFAPEKGTVSVIGRGEYVGVVAKEFTIKAQPTAVFAIFGDDPASDKAEDLSFLVFSIPILAMAAAMYVIQHRQRVQEAQRLEAVRVGTLEAKREMAELSGAVYEEYDNYESLGYGGGDLGDLEEFDSGGGLSDDFGGGFNGGFADDFNNGFDDDFNGGFDDGFADDFGSGSSNSFDADFGGGFSDDF